MVVGRIASFMAAEAEEARLAGGWGAAAVGVGNDDDGDMVV
jgi:hypothetical protein